MKAAFDGDAGVWFVEHSDVEGPHVEGETFESFRQAVSDVNGDRLSDEGDGDFLIEIVAHVCVRARAAA